MESLKEYFVQNKQRFLDELIQFLRIPSVSANPDHISDMALAANFLVDQLKAAGAEEVESIRTAGHPIVYGEKIIGDDLPTVLVYGHYDVQPPDPLELWHSPPFEPVIKDEKIYARGACDDKGQLYMHVKAFEAMMASNCLPCNIKFMFEGEEEVGSDNLEHFCQEHKEKLNCDLVLVSDTAIIANDTPSITVGLRGISYIQVEVTGPNKDLHSGVYGGGVVNPINALCEMIASLKDENNRITIPGFYDEVVDLSEGERKAMNEAPFDEETYKSELGVDTIDGEAGYTTLERVSIRPTLDVNGIWGGYTGEGSKTVLPAKAFAKISTRLVPNQDPDRITQLLIDHLTRIAKPGTQVKVIPFHGGHPSVTSVDSAAYQAAHKAMETTFGKAPIPQRGGGSIPIVSLFKEVLGVSTVLMGFGLDSDDIHSPNEHFGLFNYYKGIETIPYFYQYLSES